MVEDITALFCRINGDPQILLHPHLTDIVIKVSRTQRPVNALFFWQVHGDRFQLHRQRRLEQSFFFNSHFFLPTHALRFRSASRMRSAIVAAPRRKVSRTAFSASTFRYPRFTSAEVASLDSAACSPITCKGS